MSKLGLTPEFIHLFIIIDYAARFVTILLERNMVLVTCMLMFDYTVLYVYVLYSFVLVLMFVVVYGVYTLSINCSIARLLYLRDMIWRKKSVYFCCVLLLWCYTTLYLITNNKNKDEIDSFLLAIEKQTNNKYDTLKFKYDLVRFNPTKWQFE